jgi:hypothetical protein
MYVVSLDIIIIVIIILVNLELLYGKGEGNESDCNLFSLNFSPLNREQNA